MKQVAWRSVLAGLWGAAWVLVPALLCLPLAEPVRSQTMQTLFLAVHVLSARLIPPTPAALLWAPIAACALVALWTATILLLVRVLDRANEAERSIRWALRTWPTLLAWSAGLAAMFAAAMLMAYARIDSLLILLVPALAACTLPFFAVRADVLAQDVPPRWWVPAWPGFAPIVLGIVVLLTLSLADVALDGALAGANSVVLLAGDIAMFVAKVAGTSWILAAWQRRSSVRALRRDLAQAVRPANLRLVAAISVSVACLVGLLAVPLLVVGVERALIQPQVLRHYDLIGRSAPGLLSWYADQGATLLRWQWLPLAIAASWVYCVSAARGLWRAGPPSERFAAT